MVMVLGAGIAILIGSHSGTAIGTSGNAANLASGCTTPTATASASTTSPAPTATAAAAPTTTAAPSATATPATTTATAPTAIGTPAPAAAPAANAETTPTTAATPTATATPSATATATATAITTPTATATATPTSTASATPCPSATPSATPTTPTTPTTVANVSCDIIVPARPLTARGLATPYQLTGTDGASPATSGCNMANAANLGAFVQATILDPATGKLSVYEPLVITQGTTPAAPPVVPALPAGAIVTIDFGFNGTNLTQVGATANALRQGRCVDGLNGSIFGQVSFCNGTAFFRAARHAEAGGRLVVPSAGTSPKTGQACPTTRSFSVVDQDPSDNVTTDYLITADERTAQFNAANQAALPGATDIVNGSDNKLLTAFLDPAFGCTPFEAPDLSQSGTLGSSQALNELSAAASNVSPAALIPENDEMVLVNDAMSIAKTNLYRSEIGQPIISAANNGSDSPAGFCQNMVDLQTPFLSAGQTLLATGSSPVPAVGNNLLTFLANRLSMSFANLGCQTYGLTDPVSVTVDGNGIATAATFNTAQQTDPGATPTPSPSPSPSPTTLPRRHHPRRQNPSGM
jgi:hypothetical protein